jgi:hypothetical protein
VAKSTKSGQEPLSCFCSRMIDLRGAIFVWPSFVVVPGNQQREAEFPDRRSPP